jgi:hypothetical protein
MESAASNRQERRSLALPLPPEACPKLFDVDCRGWVADMGGGLQRNLRFLKWLTD